MPTGAYTHHVSEHVGLNYKLQVDNIREGWNRIVVYHDAPAASPTDYALHPGVCICSLELAVK